MGYKLNFELVPDGCWYSNLRSILSKEQWEFLKKYAKEKSGGKCSICGKKTKTLHAHERWSYDIDKGIQKLEDVVAVCPDCHSVIHIGRTQLVGGEERAEKHFMSVNGCTYAEYRKALGEANELHRKRNEVSEWKLDLSYLKRFVED
jgi:hypothetical protein